MAKSMSNQNHRRDSMHSTEEAKSMLQCSDFDEVDFGPTKVTSQKIEGKTRKRHNSTDAREFIRGFLEACGQRNVDNLRNYWIPKYRNSFGSLNVITDMRDEESSATALHLAILNKREDNAKLLMAEYGKRLIIEPYTEGDYEGITSLHLAIVNGMKSVVESMLEMFHDTAPAQTEFRAFIHKESPGRFLTEGWVTSSVPLTLSLLSNQKPIFELLAKKANALHKCMAKDGNTIIHSLVLHSLKDPKHAVDCLKYLIQNKDLLHVKDGSQEITDRYMKLKVLLTQKNDCGFTPLMYAIHLGASDFWDALLHVEDVYKILQWNFHPFEWNVYNVTELMKPQKPYNISGLELLAFNEQKQLKMFHTEPLKTLTDEIWKRNEWLYGLSALMHVLYMTLFTIAVLSKNMMEQDVKPMMEERAFAVVLTFIVLIMATLFFIIQIADFFKLVISILHVFIRTSVKASKLSPKKLYRISTIRTLFFLTDTFVISWAICRLIGNEFEAMVAVPPLILGWYACIVYTFYFEKICIFIFMLNQIFFTNVIYFLIALFFILIGYSTAFLNLQFVYKDAKPSGMETFLTMLSTLFRQTIAITDIDEQMDDFKYPVAARCLMVVFLIVATVLLLNMLIAAMNDTYNSVRDTKTELWLRIKLQMALHIERRTFGLLNRMPQCCSYCQPNCKCECEDEEQCKKACGCNKSMIPESDRKSISMTSNAIRSAESKDTLDGKEGCTEDANKPKRIGKFSKSHTPQFFGSDFWKNFFFRIKNENGKRQQTIFLKLKEFVKED